MTSIRPKAARAAAPRALYILDADASVREGLTRLAVSAGFEAHPCASAEARLYMTRRFAGHDQPQFG